MTTASNTHLPLSALTTVRALIPVPVASMLKIGAVTSVVTSFKPAIASRIACLSHLRLFRQPVVKVEHRRQGSGTAGSSRRVLCTSCGILNNGAGSRRVVGGHSEAIGSLVDGEEFSRVAAIATNHGQIHSSSFIWILTSASHRSSGSADTRGSSLDLGQLSAEVLVTGRVVFGRDQRYAKFLQGSRSLRPGPWNHHRRHPAAWLASCSSGS